MDSVDVAIASFESSLKRLGVRFIFRVSTLSSLKKESVLRKVPFLDLVAVPSSATVSQSPATQIWQRAAPERSDVSSLDRTSSTPVA